MISRRKLYILLSAGLLAGYILLFVETITTRAQKDAVPDLCFFKTVTGLPCPSCGSTRSVLSLLNGNIEEALWINPFGFIIAAIMLVTPLWLLYDVTGRRITLYEFYLKAESILRKPLIAAPLILIVFINWAWNIVKGL